MITLIRRKKQLGFAYLLAGLAGAGVGLPANANDLELNRPLTAEDFASPENVRQVAAEFPFKFFKTYNGDDQVVYVIVYADATQTMPSTTPGNKVNAQSRTATLSLQALLTAGIFKSAYDLRGQIRTLANQPGPRSDLQQQFNRSIMVGLALTAHGIADITLRQKYGHSLAYQIPFYLGGHQQTKKEASWIARNLRRTVDRSKATPEPLIFPVLPLHFSSLLNPLRKFDFQQISAEEYLHRLDTD